MKAAEQTIVCIHQTLIGSILSDLFSVSSLAALIGLGVILNSQAMQWCGFLLGSLWFIGRVTAVQKKSRMTPQEAADFIARNFNVRAL